MAKLSELKSLLASRKPTAAATARTPRTVRAPHSPAAAADVDLKQIFADVAPLKAINRARIDRAPPPPVASHRLADESNALAASKFGAEPSPASWEIGQEHEALQTFLREGLGNDVLVRLRRGYWSVQGELDLHRLTSAEAHDALADFVFAARARGWRCVRVIHGKGLSSKNREPVLKAKVRAWLARWDEVLAYCEAPRHGGGSGAVIVLLKAAPA